ncbi:MAG: peptidoglycan-binding protein [Chromatiaceae bacterium]|nr:peptidoglycan-binding protein [Chromatiaceae bacterium]MBP6734398.1 peptidoglycan-binding protein [Chromatiaceae bacterium]MBP8290130.1 peptidoglycan-binding protein [Chromatiaceae bacterium]
MAATLVLLSAAASGAPLTSALYAGNGGVPEVTLAAYRALSASLSRGYDRTRDISPRQLLTLLEVAERTETSLGQALATGEMESAHTWNDHVRPPLANGQLGSATGVWQFLPATFHGIIKEYGAQLLAATAADAAANRAPLDLGEGPYTDAQVRGLIQETVAGKRGAGDEELQLLRHNFAVLAFAKHYLSLDSGATTPEEDYLFHFLGEGQGRRVLALARGEARDTLCVQMLDAPTSPLDTGPKPQGGEALVANQGATKAPSPQQPPPRVTTQAAVAAASFKPHGLTLATARPVVAFASAPSGASLPSNSSTPSVITASGTPNPTKPPKADNPITALVATLKTAAGLAKEAPPAAPPAVWTPPPPAVPPPPSAEWGLAATSPTVTSNPGMFYRDGRQQTQPYTWAEFLDHLARQVRAQDQPALVRAKYGVGFPLKGGDMPERAFNPDEVTEAAAFHHEISPTLRLPETLITGPLDPDETREYQARLAALVAQGDDQPLDRLPPEALAALQHLRLLSPETRELSTRDPKVSQALREFRQRVGKAEPDDPTQIDRLLPAERVALALYDQRLTRYAALQAGQQASATDAPDLNRINKMPKGLRKFAAPHLAAVQRALAAQGLLTPPTQKVVWRDKKRKKHIEYKKARFAGKPDQATITALDSFQWRHGLQQTAGVLDVVTLNLLGLPSLGPELFQPLSGSQCLIDDLAEPPAWCEITKATPAVKQQSHDALHITLQTPPRASPRLIATALESNGMSSSNRPPTSSCW